MNMIVRMLFGSHLYGTATSSSDVDFKGVNMPPLRSLLLHQVPRTESRNTKTDRTAKNIAVDVDEETYSLHYFVDLACQGQTVAIDMLHAPLHKCTHFSDIWEDLRSLRALFYTKNLSALVGYARRQAAKYGIKGSRLSAAKTVLDAFRGIVEATPDARLRDVWDGLPRGEHIHCIIQDPKEDGVIPPRLYQVCGKRFMETALIRHYIPALQAFVNEYGVRAQMAERNEGVDWKAVSHAMRAGLQTKAILVDGGFEFPLPEADTLRAIKQGHLPYVDVASQLEDLIDECEQLAARSLLPDKVDRAWWEDWLVDTVRGYFKLHAT